ncbi:MAG: DUF2946 family protein [Hylemonella sp.]
MDEIVRQAMAKWPHVPACYGWLALDARGNWYMRDERVQAAGAFDSGVPQAKGSLLRHDKLLEFIGRNYGCDEAGCWYFQNGPQRVFVELEATPWIWRLQPDGRVHSHTGQPAQVLGAEVDEAGRLYLRTDLGFGLVHSQDMALAADWIEQGRWVPEPVRAAQLPQRHRYVRSPQRDRAGSPSRP